MFVSEKSSKPRQFMNFKFLPCRYSSQQKSQIDGVLSEEWVRELDRKFASKGRIIVLVIDKCPKHPHIENLKSVKLFFYHRT